MDRAGKTLRRNNIVGGDALVLLYYLFLLKKPALRLCLSSLLLFNLL